MSAVLPSSSSERLLVSFLTDDVAHAIRDAVLSGLNRQPQRGLEVGGILTSRALGVSRPVADETIPIASEYRFGPNLHLSAADLIQLLDQSEQLRATGTKRILGFWRSAIDGNLSFTTDDLDIIRDIFPEAHLLLIVKATVDAQTIARVFQALEGGAWTPAGDFELLSAPAVSQIKARTSTSITRPPAAIERARAPQSLPSHNLQPPLSAPLQVPQAAEAPAWIPGKWRNITLLVGLFLLSAAVSSTWFMIQSRRPEPAARSASKDLGMQVEHNGGSLRLSWNTQSKLVQTARGGILLVDDGIQHHQFLLDAGQVSNGYILFTPASSDVTFRLEIPDPGQKLVVETVRVLDGSRDSATPVNIRTPAPSPAGETAASRSAGILADPRTGKQIAARAVPVQEPTPAPVPASRNVLLEAPSFPATPRRTERRSVGETTPPPELTASDISPAVVIPSGRETFTPAPPPSEPVRRPAPAVSAPVTPPAQSPNLAGGPAKLPDLPKTPAVIPNPENSISPAAKFQAPRPTKQVMPNKNQFGPSVIYGPTEVQVMVKVDANGSVKEAHIVNSKKASQNMLLVTQAIAAAKEWKFEPAKVSGKNTDGMFTIVFQFAPKN